MPPTLEAATCLSFPVQNTTTCFFPIGLFNRPQTQLAKEPRADEICSDAV